MARCFGTLVRTNLGYVIGIVLSVSENIGTWRQYTRESWVLVSSFKMPDEPERRGRGKNFGRDEQSM